MSKETMEYLNSGAILVGDGETPWWRDESFKTAEDVLYAGAIPVDDVHRRLFHWEAEDRALGVLTPVGEDDEEYRGIYSHKAVVRNDTGALLGIHGSEYKIHQYGEWLVENAQKLLGSGVHISSAGLLRGGAQAWVSISLNETLSASDLLFKPQLLLATSHDGSLASTTKQVVTLAVCDNTMAAALGESSKAHVKKHTSRSKWDTEEAATTLGLLEAVGQQFSSEVEKYLATPVSEDQYHSFLDKYIPVPEAEGRGKTMATKKRERFLDLWEQDPMVHPFHGTKFGVLQAVNTYNHHDTGVKRVSQYERNMTNAITGRGQKTDQEAMRVLSGVLEAV